MKRADREIVAEKTAAQSCRSRTPAGRDRSNGRRSGTPVAGQRRTRATEKPAAGCGLNGQTHIRMAIAIGWPLVTVTTGATAEKASNRERRDQPGAHIYSN